MALPPESPAGSLPLGLPGCPWLFCAIPCPQRAKPGFTQMVFAKMMMGLTVSSPSGIKPACRFQPTQDLEAKGKTEALATTSSVVSPLGCTQMSRP